MHVVRFEHDSGPKKYLETQIHTLIYFNTLDNKSDNFNKMLFYHVFVPPFFKQIHLE